MKKKCDGEKMVWGEKSGQGGKTACYTGISYQRVMKLSTQVNKLGINSPLFYNGTELMHLFHLAW